MAFFRSNVSGGLPAGVKTLPTYKTASGSVATFETDMTENLISCVADIVAQQASGTPSPSNPLPISGISAVNVSACGKNIFNPNAFISAGATVVDNVYTISQSIPSGTAINLSLPKNTKLTFSYKAKYQTNVCDYYILVRYTDGTYSRDVHATTANTWGEYQFTTDNTKTIRDVILGIYSSSRDTEFKELQIEKGEDKTTFEPYTGTTATCNLGDTYYGGSVDVVTGKLRVTSNYIDLSTLSWNIADNVRVRTRLLGYSIADMSGFACNIFNPTNVTSLVDRADWDITYIPNNYYPLDVKVASGTTLTDFQNLVADIDGQGNHAYLVIPYATPTTAYASNSLEIPTINGTNNLFSDVDSVTAKYILSVGEALRQG